VLDVEQPRVVATAHQPFESLLAIEQRQPAQILAVEPQ
jgi:hypothetical protein